MASRAALFLVLPLTLATLTSGQTYDNYSSCLVLLDNPKSVFGHSKIKTEPLSEYVTDLFEDCANICCFQDACSVVLYSESSSEDEFNCAAYSCHPLSECSIKVRRDVKVFVKPKELESETTASPVLDTTLPSVVDVNGDNMDNNSTNDLISLPYFTDQVIENDFVYSSLPILSTTSSLWLSSSSALSTSLETTTANLGTPLMTADYRSPYPDFTYDYIYSASDSEPVHTNDASASADNTSVSANDTYVSANDTSVSENDTSVSAIDAFVLAESAKNYIYSDSNLFETVSASSSDQFYYEIQPSKTVTIESSSYSAEISIGNSDIFSASSSLEFSLLLQSSTSEILPQSSADVTYQTTSIALQLVEGSSTDVSMTDFRTDLQSSEVTSTSTSIISKEPLSGEDNTDTPVILQTSTVTQAISSNVPDFDSGDSFNETNVQNWDIFFQPSESTTVILIAALTLGCLFALFVVGILGVRVYDSYKKRHYTRLDFLINGMYS